jgi:hypothetical protein
MTRALGLGFCLLSLSAGCAASRPSLPSLQPTRLSGTDGALHELPAAAGAGFSVLVFFSVSCDCQLAHDLRLVELARRYARQGVAFFAVDSEVGSTLQGDALEARKRNYPYPILLDANARLASELGAEYATYSVVLDRRGRVRYRGGVDSDQVHLTDDATEYLRDALDDLLAGHEPRRAFGEALGCSLRTE